VKRTGSVLLPAEQVVLFFLSLALFFYSLLDLPLRYPWTIYSGRVWSSLLFYILALVCAFLCCCLSDLHYRLRTGLPVNVRTTFKNYANRYLRRYRIVNDLRLVHVVALMFTVFLNLKHLIPYLNARLYDAPLASVDRWLFKGELASLFLQRQIGLGAAPILSDIYVFFYPFIALALYTVLLGGTQRRVQEFFAAFTLVWFLGLMLVYLYPTLGPIFYFPELFTQLPHTRVSELQVGLWEHKVFLDKEPRSAAGLYLISGLPSLHIAAPLLASYFLCQINRWIGCASYVFVFLTFVSTIYFGWHYAADDLAAVLLVIGVVMLNRRLFDYSQYGS